MRCQSPNFKIVDLVRLRRRIPILPKTITTFINFCDFQKSAAVGTDDFRGTGLLAKVVEEGVPKVDFLNMRTHISTNLSTQISGKRKMQKTRA